MPPLYGRSTAGPWPVGAFAPGPPAVESAPGRAEGGAVHVVNPPNAVAELTRLYRGERFDDGRPRVPDGVVERMRPVTTEEAWGFLRRQGYEWQFEGSWQVTHPERILVGRA